MKTKKLNARVIYFDKLRGEGMVKFIDSPFPRSCYEIFACNIKGKKTWFPETACVFYEQDQIISCEVRWDKYSFFVIGLTKGKFDKEKFNNLDKEKLAFKCDSKGRAINGLFK